MEYLKLHEIKKIEKEILVKFAEFCEKNGLTYMLCGGTLLGAVRHKGFIPWDDDIDVLMPRPDYERLNKLLNEQAIDGRYELISWKNKKSVYPFLKLVDNQTEVVEELIDNKYKTGVWVDIFPIDGCPESEKKVKKIYRKQKFIRMLFFTLNCPSEFGTSKLAIYVKKILRIFFKKVDPFKMAEKMDYFSKKYSFEESPCVAGIVWGYGPQEKMPRSFLETVDVEFEGHIFKTTKEWDLYLSNLYGNYMELPPENKRIVHNMKAYKK